MILRGEEEGCKLGRTPRESFSCPFRRHMRTT